MSTIIYRGWAGLLNCDSYPFFLINVAFNRERGGIKEVEGRLCCYKLYVQLRLEEKDGDNDQLCAQHHNLFTKSSFLHAADLHQLLHQFWDLNGCNASSHTYQNSLLSHCCINFFVDSALLQFTKVKVQICKFGGMAAPVPVNGEPTVPTNQDQPSVQEV